MDHDEDYGVAGLLEEPADYYPPPPPPTRQVFTMRSGRAVTLHLVGASPTEANHLWNGARVVSDYLEARPSRVRGRTVLELGAASGLPSLVAGLLGARKVVMTDFPDPDLVANMQKNIDAAAAAAAAAGVVEAAGFVWGRDVAPLLARLDGGGAAAAARFDVLILADLLFRHGEHGMLVKTIREAMARDGVAYVFFTSYRPWKRDRDMRFFEVAREAGLEVVRVEERVLEKPMFENDPGDVEVQKTVNGFEVRWPGAEVSSGEEGGAGGVKGRMGEGGPGVDKME